MSTARKPLRTCLRAITLTLAAGALAVIQIAGTPLAQAAAAPHTPTLTGASSLQAREVIVCEEARAELPNLFAQRCNSRCRGPLSDVVVVRGNDAAYYRLTGWVEGSTWPQGRDCRRISSGG
ncbi:hypothetical protein ACIQU6_08440 [Streptomyces sp. NPDC090442]|uniref:hypothetical protein n=1 Tax=Streptomyces sp. NPDC090442 TaxID=3365962 RepID=UPI003814AC1E